MRVALLTTLAASRKEPLAEVLDRINAAFAAAELREPAIRFNFADGGVVTSFSCVDRVLKRFPDLERFVTTAPPAPSFPPVRRLSNGPLSPAAGQSIEYTTLRTIAAGVPRSFPFHSVAIHFHSPEFGGLVEAGQMAVAMMAGVRLADSWWVNGRQRGLSACTFVEADEKSKKLPPLPPGVAAVLAGCGKIRKTVQAPLPAPGTTGPVPGVRLPGGVAIPSVKPETVAVVQAVVLDYRARLNEVIERARMPHDLPTHSELLQQPRVVEVSGPKKPALVAAFKPMGYQIKGDTGSFTLRRRTAANLTVELYLDVGTWSNTALAIFHVYGLGFKATLFLPAGPRVEPRGQYPIGGAERWQKIVENLGAMVSELERCFVPDVEKAAGPSPEWYEPEK